MESYFAPCPRGLEGALADELRGLGADEITATEGGVAFAGALDLAYRANLESRLASRILWRVGDSAYRNERDIYESAYALDWPRSEEHTSELQSRPHLVCRLLLEKKKK